MLGIALGYAVRVPCFELCSAAANLQGSKGRYCYQACGMRALCCELCSVAADLQIVMLGSC